MTDPIDDLLGFKLTPIGADEIFAPLPPANHICMDLDIAPGAPTMVAGYGFSGKTTAVMAFGLDVALFDQASRFGLGQAKAWQHLPIQRGGRVLHLDFEMGKRLVCEKYQRLARAHPTRPDIECLRDRLAAVILPTSYLDQDGAEVALGKLCDGVALCIVDSLRACAPNTEENSSEVRKVLDMFTRVSEATGCVFLVIHHSRKVNDSNGGGAAQSLRGSSAIFDACSSVLVFTGKKGEPSHVAHEKSRNRGVCADDFNLEIHDVEVGGMPRAGLMVGTSSGPAAIGVPEGWKDAESKIKSQMIALLARVEIETKTSLVHQVKGIGSNQLKFNMASQLRESELIDRKQPRLTPKARERIAYARKRIIEMLRTSGDSVQVRRDCGEQAARAVARLQAMDGQATVDDLRRWLSKEGLDVYVDAAVDEADEAKQVAKVLINKAPGAKLPNWTPAQRGNGPAQPATNPVDA